MSKRTIDRLASMQDILKTAIEIEEEAMNYYIQARKHARTHEEETHFDSLAKQNEDRLKLLKDMLQEIEAQIEIDRALSYDVY